MLARCRVPLVLCALLFACSPTKSGSGARDDGQAGSGASQNGGGSSISVELPDAAGRTSAAGSNGTGVTCGNGALDDEESCDDGNAVPGDGCSGLCQVEEGFECPTPGQPCVPTVVCGDGEVGKGELCDDGNTESGDGCVATCTSAEPGYVCPPEGGACTEVLDVCGNALIELGEECDDANSVAGDGCSADCRQEPGWVCPEVGQPCRPIEFCGDGIVTYTRGETCDDGGTDPGDGCSDLCRIEPGWVCTGEPSTCTYDVICGDQRIRGNETCDDGNTDAGDGCSDTCQLEPGWTCPVLGAACRALCGDGLILGREQCDDGNTDDGDGCSANCRQEPGWVCPEGEACRATVCGDGVREGSEACDDGNTQPFDGCSPTCVNEPTCGTETSAIGACTSTCGDGILLRGGGEVCDDGNNVDGDGCSADCKTVEPGYECSSAYDNPPENINIPIVYRDFPQYQPANADTPAVGNADFGTSCCGSPKGIVEDLLDANRKPVYSGTDAAPVETTSGKTSFDQWYRDTSGINLRFDQSLTLTRLASGSYSMNSDTDEPFFTRCGFYPLEDTPRLDANTGLPVTYTSNGYDDDGDPNTPMVTRQCYAGVGWGFGEQWLNHNYLFTSELRYWFEYQGGEVLEFSGDDDVWVFINGRLAVDLGGVHDRQEGGVTLTLGADGATNAQYGLTKGQIYEAVLFQAERWCCDSNYWLTLSNFSSGSSECAPQCGDGVVTADEACDLGTDANGVSLNTGEYGGCTPDCQLSPFCGDGVKNGGEECDDGSNIVPYDSTGQTCAPGCVLSHYCGDGVLDTTYGEACDAGAANSASAYGPGSCDATCQPGPFCGDGFLNGDEDCDDGPQNGSVASGCATDCRIQCGNGVVDPGEECDLGADNNVGGYDGCTSSCTLGPHCGDGIKNGSEACDDGTNDGSYGTCMPDCTPGPYCGDGHVDGPEQCDQGSDNITQGYGPDLCTTQCQVAPYCGDGILQDPEECDGGSDCDAECKWNPVE